jgi:NADH:ubiquinone oxidoreductase subunit 4 (subunit M)
LAFPGTGGFIAELLVIIGLFNIDSVLGIIVLIGSLFCGIYSLLMFSKIFFGRSLFLVLGGLSYNLSFVSLFEFMIFVNFLA